MPLKWKRMRKNLGEFDKLVMNEASADYTADTTSCYYVQDYKRSSCWNIEHGYVGT